jgi:serine/threonine protein kinase
VSNEILFLAKLNHECIPKLSEIFITESSVYLVTNYIDPFRLANFIDVKEGKSPLHIADVRRIAKSLCSALVHCHDRGVIVRDLTPQNIMVLKSGLDGNTGGSMKIDVMITDFALAVQAGSTQALADHPLFNWNMVPYTAPEALLGHEYSFPMDCWALGTLIYVMLSGIEPFHHDDDHVLVENIKTASFDFEEDAFDSVDKVVKMLIVDLLRPLPEGRLTAKQAMKNNWFTQSFC